MNILSHGKLVTALQYFTDRVEDYWHILYPLCDPDKRKGDPFLYFYDLSRKAIDFDGQFTEDGIYLFKGYDGKWHLHALEIAQYALACWMAWRKTKEKHWLKAALRQCDWLVSHQAENGAWYIEHKNPKYNDLPSPWVSGMAQGLAISALIRAYLFSNESRYLEAAMHSAVFLEKSIADGGVKRDFSQRFIYEEYPREALSGVLNGYISSVLGIYELSLHQKDFKKLFQMNLANLKKILPLYDNGYWSLYALDGTLSSGFYHRYVITQLKAMEMFDNFFKMYSLRFESYLNNPVFVCKALYKKMRSR